MGNPKFTINCSVALLPLVLLTGCSNYVSLPAPISSINECNSSSITSSSLTNIRPSRIDSRGTSKMYLHTQSTHSIQNLVPSNIAQKGNNPFIYNRQYENILRGSYDGSNVYSVKRGDTLFYIAWITGNNFHDLARRNNIQSPYKLYVGQILQLSNPRNKILTSSNTSSTTEVTAQNYSIKYPKKINIINKSKQEIAYLNNSSGRKTNKILINNIEPTGVIAPVTAPIVSSMKSIVNNNISSSSPYVWLWPTKGKIIENFSSSERGNKGIDIAGSKGQAIVATADGRIVYAGSALRGYGNLIIIKHNGNYLSAYAHNDTILVKEQQEVKKGQKIATMGRTGASSTRLHFEIRYKGKSVNPLQYLP